MVIARPLRSSLRSYAPIALLAVLTFVSCSAWSQQAEPAAAQAGPANTNLVPTPSTSAQPTDANGVKAEPSAAQTQPRVAQQPAAAAPKTPENPVPASTPAVPSAPVAPPLATGPQPSAATDAQGGGITEEQLKQSLVGKPFYLRDCYLDAALSFNEHGGVTGHPTPGSYTLCGVSVEKVKLSKHKVELSAIRYGLHFLGAMPYEDPTKAVDRVRITPAKKIFRITIDREIVVKPKKVKEKGKDAKGHDKKSKGKKADAAGGTQVSAPAADSSKTADTSKTAEAAKAGEDADDDQDEGSELSPAEQLKASITKAPEPEKPADPNSVTTTTSPAHAAQVLREALERIFAPGLDEAMMAKMPDFWKFYYAAAAAKSDYRPKDTSVMRQSAVDRKAHLITNFEPASNEFAQASGVAGMSLYHVVIGADGKPGEVAVARPIGFGLDENAVTAIRNARFEPAMKDGKAVSVLVDLVVQFRIFSKRTAVSDVPQAADKANKPAAPAPQAPILPGPYSRPQ